MFVGVARENERSLPDAHRRRQTGRALRLQAQQHAGRFEQRRLSSTIRTDDEIESGREFDRSRFEATEVAQLQVAEHHAFTG